MRIHYLCRMRLLLALSLSITYTCFAQDYTSYITGDSADVITNPVGGICLMGGAAEDDEAMKWFLQRANGGDILVLRASGADGYNNYMYATLGVSINSVETIVFDDPSASNSTYIHERIEQAEAIWFAGGDQWDYISYWRGTAIDSLINIGITQRNIVIGGTSAGMAILGGFYFTAENGSITSPNAMFNPYHMNITIDSAAFLNNQILSDVITDTHYDNPNRKGRHVTFLARILTDYDVEAKGIACDEYTAICIDQFGIAHVYGKSPNYDDNAYFIQINCENEERTPENCSASIPLNWDRNHAALKVYKVQGTTTGTNTFDLNSWLYGSGGEWENWYVDFGSLSEDESTGPICEVTGITTAENLDIALYPNPSYDFIHINGETSLFDFAEVYSVDGTKQEVSGSTTFGQIDIRKLEPGYYFIRLVGETTLDLPFLKN